MVDFQYATLYQTALKQFEAEHFLAARDTCNQILKKRPKDPAASLLLAQIDWKAEQRDEAVRMLQALLGHSPRDYSARLQLGYYLNYLGRHREAIVQFEKAARLKPGSTEPIEYTAEVHENAGQGQAARSLLRPFVGTERETPRMGLVLAKLSFNERDYEQAAELAKRHLAGDTVAPDTRSELLFVLGQALERLNDIDAAMAAYHDAHQQSRPPFSREDCQRGIDRLIESFTPELLSMAPRAKNRSERPLFIITLPRSGSTLVERILSSHPAVCDAGELPFITALAGDLGFSIGSTREYPECVSDLDQGDVDHLGKSYLDRLSAINRSAKRVTDKHLGNWKHLGFVELICPGSRIIDLRRNAVDHGFACYCASLGPTQAFSYDLADIGFYRREYERLMDHWHNVLSVPILRLNYEDLVEDQDYWSRRLIEFCGLEWDDRCLEFHKHGGKGSAGFTLSYAQVRQPIYKTSVNRAQKFRKHLGPLYEALGIEPDQPEAPASDDAGSR